MMRSLLFFGILISTSQTRLYICLIKMPFLIINLLLFLISLFSTTWSHEDSILHASKNKNIEKWLLQVGVADNDTGRILFCKL